MATWVTAMGSRNSRSCHSLPFGLRTSRTTTLRLVPLPVWQPKTIAVISMWSIVGDCCPSPDISHYLGASGRRISESCCATTTFWRFEERPDADRV
jgi:hypothetical protein